MLAFSVIVTEAIRAEIRPRAVSLSPSEIIQIDSENGTVLCGSINAQWIPGVIKRNGLFVSWKAKLRAFTKAIREATLEEVRNKLRRKKSKTRNKKIAQEAVCGTIVVPAPTESPTPAPGTPTPGATPTVTPTPGGSQPTPTPSMPTPTPTPQCFDAEGNTTCFGIPFGLEGNINRGMTAYQSFCTCHSDLTKLGSTFSQIQGAFFTVPEMTVFQGFFLDSDIADITAYLNRPLD